MTTPKKAAKKAPKKTTATELKPKKTAAAEPKAKKITAAEPEPKKTAKAKKASALKPDVAEAILEAVPETLAEAVAEVVFVAEVEAAAVDELVAEEAVEVAAVEAEIEVEAEDDPESEEIEDVDEPESTPMPRPPAKLERLQKILAAAGVASRRSAETMIEQGRVQVNGKVVTELGTKADAGRDHIRVDGKLLQGAERLRYFILNKPRGFVTTVKDPEGRPTVMQFFDKMKERLYPVGRLDYLSEGLLVVTNDGELANKLTKASSGVEKTYLVKVAGQPTEAELDILRGGVSIALGKPGSRSVRTSPARIRQVRQGDNPWYEVVLIEGRNRELRKMFEEIGHFVEKIRRTGYGPLVLDQEPGNLRELEPVELEALRKAAEGKLRTPKSKDLRRRNLIDAGLLPTVLPKPSGRPRTAPPAAPLPTGDVSPVQTDWSRPGAFKAKKFSQNQSAQSGRPTQPTDRFASGDANKFFRPARPSGEGFRPAAGRTSAPNPVRSFSSNEEERPPRSDNRASENFGFNRPSGRSFDRPDARTDSRSAARPVRNFERPAGRPAWKQNDRPTPPPARAAEGSSGDARPFTPKPAWKKPERPGSFSRPDRSSRPERSARPDRPARPDFKRSGPPRRDLPARETRVFDEDLEPIRPPNLHIEEITGPSPSSYDRPSAPRSSYSRPSGRSSTNRPGAPRSYSDRSASSRPSPSRPYADRSTPSRPSAPRSYPDRPASDRPSSDRPRPSRPSYDRAAPSGRPSSFRPRPDRPTGDRPSRPSFSRPEGGRPSFTSSGQPRPGGARPSSKPGKFSKPGGSKPYKPRTEGASDYRPTKAKPYPSSASRAERKAGPAWKPKSNFSPGKPSSSTRSKPKPGSSAKPSHRVKPGGKSSGKKRNY
jgi:23S rRNA pseudouridine2605 synthase